MQRTCRSLLLESHGPGQRTPRWRPAATKPFMDTTETSRTSKRIRAGREGIGEGTRLCRDRKADTLIARLELMEKAESKEKYWGGRKSMDGEIFASHQPAVWPVTGRWARPSRDLVGKVSHPQRPSRPGTFSRSDRRALAFAHRRRVQAGQLLSQCISPITATLRVVIR